MQKSNPPVTTEEGVQQKANQGGKGNKIASESPCFQQITEEESVQNTMTTDSNFANTLSLRDKEYLKVMNEKMKILDEFEKQQSVIKAKRQVLEQSLNQSTQKNNNANSNIEKVFQGEILNFQSMRNSQLQNIPEDLNQKQGSLHQQHASPRHPLKEVEECTFQPKINQNAAKLSQRQFNDENYMVNYLYGDAVSRKEKTQQKLNQEVQIQQQVVNKSKISMKSQKIVLKKIEEALLSLLESLQEQENDEYISFENLGLFFEKLGLFKALKFKKDQNETSLQLGDRIKINMERLQSEMIFHEQIWRILSISSDNESFVPKRLVFEIVMILLEKKLLINQAVNLFKDALAAKLSKTREQVDEMLMLSAANQVNQDQQNDQQQQESTAWSLEQLIMEFRQLLEDKTSLMEWYSTKNNSILQQLMDQQSNNSQLSFKPQINEKSRLIDSSVGEGYFMKVITRNQNEKNDSKILKNRYDMLFEHSKYLQDKQQEDKQKYQQIELDQCTFHPKINNSAKRMQSPQPQSNFQQENLDLQQYLSENDDQFENQVKVNQNKVQLKQKQQIKQQIQPANEQEEVIPRYEKLYKQYQKKTKQLEEAKERIDKMRKESETQECTFVPNTRKAIIIDKSTQINNVKGVKQTIARMNKAREDKSEKNSYWDKKKQQWMNHKTDRITNLQPYQLQTDERRKKEKGEFLGNIDINFSKGKKGRIVIYKDDDPEQLAENFSKIYSLSEDMKLTLKVRLAHYMEKLLEEQVSNQSDGGPSDIQIGEQPNQQQNLHIQDQQQLENIENNEEENQSPEKDNEFQQEQKTNEN